MSDTQPNGGPDVPLRRRLAGLLGALALLGCVLAVVTPSEAAFPGTNGKIAFTSDPTGSDLEIYTMNGDGNSQIDVSNDASSDSGPSWSPDGTKIAFSTDRDLNDEIYVMNPDGTAPTRVTNTAGSETVPAWSPDGQKILFTHDDGSFNLEIYVMNADGTNRTPLTTNPEIDTGAVWSPDGSKIAFTTTRDGNSEIYVMNTDGTGQTNLTNNAATDTAADWSPDSEKIAFTSRRDLNAEIYVMDANGNGPTRLTNNTTSDFSPAFSPDGSKIAFRSNRDGNAEIYVMDASGADQTRLTSNTWLDLDPDWQPASGSPTAAATAGFAAKRTNGYVRLTWRTSFEVDAAGFNLWRRRRVTSSWRKLNRTLIHSVVGGNTRGHAYSWIDRSGGLSEAHTYRLQAVSLSGKRSWVGRTTVAG